MAQSKITTAGSSNELQSQNSKSAVRVKRVDSKATDRLESRGVARADTNAVTTPPPETVEDTREVDHTVLQNWLRRARRKFWHGVVVVKVTSLGKLVRRVIYVGAKPEYFEISSAKLFDIGYHLSDVDDITMGTGSPDFQAFYATNPPRSPKAEKSCVVNIESRPISLVFKTESDRRDFMFLMRVELRAVRARYTYITKKFEDRRLSAKKMQTKSEETDDHTAAA